MLNFPSDSSTSSSLWTSEETKKFEQLLVQCHGQCPIYNSTDFPNKSQYQLLRHYFSLVTELQAIEDNQVPIPSYRDDEKTVVVEQEKYNEGRKKGVAAGKKKRDPKLKWTEEEHRLFLEGLAKGSGDWRRISRVHVPSKSPAQVASHAQKYYLRQIAKERGTKRRKSIHDITIESLNLQRPDVNADLSMQQELEVATQSQHMEEHVQMQEQPVVQLTSESQHIEYARWQQEQNTDHMISELDNADFELYMISDLHHADDVDWQNLNNQVQVKQQSAMESNHVQGIQEGQVAHQALHLLPKQGIEAEINQGQGLHGNEEFLLVDNNTNASYTAN